MKIVLAFEGADGAGKSTLVNTTKNRCAEFGRQFTAVGRREASASPVVARLTKLLHEDAGPLLPHADVFVRIAREYQRATLAAAVPTGVVVLDRFVLSILGLVRFYGHDADPIVNILKDMAARAHLFATVLVQCPFDLAASRVQQRNKGSLLRVTGDERAHRRLAELIEEDFRRGGLTGQQWPVDGSGELQKAEAQLTAYLYPYLKKHGSTPSPDSEIDKQSKPATDS
jgi:thymidylate kinase